MLNVTLPSFHVFDIRPMLIKLQCTKGGTMFGFGIPELLLILVVLLLVVGPGKLPQLGASLGETIRSFRKGSREEPRVINPKEDEKLLEKQRKEW
jgi:sec-independent protein translocase protein TatA